ncbi:UxaA family hydrolase [Paenibacillus yanchengensis]|uniref:UxaA family hydrolase n=1 Tax=Paenibacillus yanchengensis TaxID=2035833 RepID=A0ABW4YN95_9BACL
MEKQSLDECLYQIDRNDNVCVALADLPAGVIRVNGTARLQQLDVKAELTKGHKVANQFIAETQAIIKYGVVVAIATTDIEAGEWVHLHNCKSAYDERSASLDLHSGAPTDISYS